LKKYGMGQTGMAGEKVVKVEIGEHQYFGKKKKEEDEKEKKEEPKLCKKNK
jgi:hypothetical protein